MNEIFKNIETVLLGLGVTLATIAIILLGLRLIFSGTTSQGGIRVLLQGGASVLIGILLVGAAATIAGAAMTIAKSL